MNYQDTFMTLDGLINLGDELAFSILPEYKCNAGCKTCRVAKAWPGKLDLSKVLVPEADIFNIAKYFNTLCIYDDLNYIKTNEGLFDFYKRNEQKFWSDNLTDRAIPQQLDILLNDLNLIGVREVSLFDHYIVDPKLIGKYSGLGILDLVKDLNEKYKIKRIKIMLTNAEDACNPKVDEVHKWAEKLGMDILYIGNFLRTDNKLLQDLKDYKFKHLAEFEKDPALIYYIQKGKMWKADSCGLYLINNKLETNAMKPGLYNIKNFNAKEFIYILLKSKLEDYTAYAKQVDIEYFNGVSKDLILNKDFNLIPEILLPSYYVYAQKLLEEGFVKTDYGLYKPDGREVKSIIEWRSLCTK